jgi:hypothetical protein
MKKILISTPQQSPMQVDENGDTWRQMFGQSEKKDSVICRAKNCNEILVPDWTSRIDSRYCKNCLD